MDLIFGGDIAWPASDVLDLSEVERWAAGHALVLNLEGPIIPDAAEKCAVEDLYKFNIYSDQSVLQELRRLNVVACGLANNHICDYRGALDHTVSALGRNDIAAFGMTRQPWCRLTVGDREYVLWAGCSSLPEPTRLPDGQNRAEVLEPAAAIKALRDLRQKYPKATVVAFVHWGYELAHFPQPADREWARKAIDAGVDCVIGHHPHLAQGLEAYGQGLIAYSLGNFAMPQVEYRGRSLRYKSERVCRQLVLKHGAGGVRAAWMQYDKARSSVVVSSEQDALQDPELAALTPFAGMDDAAYRDWFKTHGRQATEFHRAAGPTFWGYSGVRGAVSQATLAFLGMRKRVRRLAIQTGIHKPYNW